MGVADGFKGAGMMAKVAFVLLLIAALFAWIGYCCPAWGRQDNAGSNNDAFFGLWRYCSNGLYVTSCNSIDGWALDWVIATQALVTIGFIGLNVALFLLILYMFVSSCQKNGEVGIGCAIICIVTGVLYLIGVIVFAAKFKEDYIDVTNSTWELGYAFALSVVALVLEIVAGVLVFVDSKSGGTSPSA